MLQKIPATVVTGFLGAVKTTLIRHMLQNAHGKRIALIINEFGDLGVDGDILKGCGDDTCTPDDIMELSNGCICCTVADDFIPTIKSLLERDNKPDHIVIETSGLALPQPLIRAFNWPEISTKVTVDGVITVVDGKAVQEGRFAHDIEAVDNQRKLDENLDHETPLSELYEDQIACADMIIINKADLLTSEETVELTQTLKENSRTGVQVIKSTNGALPIDVLLGQGVAAESDMKSRHELHHHHEHDHDDFEIFVFSFGEIVHEELFIDKIISIIKEHDILRLKGFIAVKDKPMRMTIQAVGPRIDTYYDQPFGTDLRATKLVVIWQSGLDQNAIKTALSDHH